MFYLWTTSTDCCAVQGPLSLCNGRHIDKHHSSKYCPTRYLRKGDGKLGKPKTPFAPGSRAVDPRDDQEFQHPDKTNRSSMWVLSVAMEDHDNLNRIGSILKIPVEKVQGAFSAIVRPGTH